MKQGTNCAIILFMKIILQLYCKYNMETNKTLISIMNSMSKNKLVEKRKIFYQDLYGLYKHLVAGSWHYLNALHVLSNEKFCQNLPPLAGEEENPSVEELGNTLKQLSEILMNTADRITNEDLNIRKKKIRIYNGRTLDMSIWQYFLQHITHQTHHQGQISCVLDELGIEHEFGNVFPLIPDSV